MKVHVSGCIGCFWPNYSTGHGDYSIYTRVKYEQYGGFTRVLHESYVRVKIYT